MLLAGFGLGLGLGLSLIIAAGIAGIGAVLSAIPWLVEVVRWVGAAFLVGYGMLAARRAWRPRGALVVDGSGAVEPGMTTGAAPTVAPPQARLRTVVLTALALTWLNPHVYLDTVFLLGSIAGTHGDARWVFGAGAIVASLVWFTALGFGARYLSRWLSTPRAWRWLDAGIAVVMVAMGLSLVLVR